MGIAKKPDQTKGRHPGRAEMEKELKADETKRLTVDLPTDVYRRLRLYAAEHEVSISAVVRAQLRELLDNQEG